MKKFILTGETPSKKNQKRVFARGNKVIVLPSLRYTQWHEKAVIEILQQKLGFFTEECEMILLFYHKDYHLRDSDNGTSSIFDTAKDSGIIKDDNWQVIPKYVVFNDIDKDCPRCEVYFYAPDEKREWCDKIIELTMSDGLQINS